MKVLQINSVCGVGSTGRIVTDIDSKLRKNNIESYFAYGRDTSVNNDHTLRIGSKLDCYVHAGLTRLFDTHVLWGSWRATSNFIKQIKNINPDIIHLHNLHGYYINIKILFDYLKDTGKPVVWTLHDCWSFTGHCAHFTYIQCDKWREECHKCPQKKSYPASIFIDNSKRNYHLKKEIFNSLKNMTIVTPSKWLADLVRKSFLSKYSVKVINNGIDADVFKPVADESVLEKYKIGHKFNILGVASIWSERKGLRYFIELSGMIDDDCEILLVGLDKKQIKKLPSKIIGIKRISNINELVQIYSLADVFINPTLEDNFPTVNIEALACGTPVITFNTGGSSEIMDDNCGYVVEKGNISEIKKYIDIVKSNGKDYYSEKCVKRVKDNFDKNDCFDEYVELYKRLDENLKE